MCIFVEHGALWSVCLSAINPVVSHPQTPTLVVVALGMHDSTKVNAGCRHAHHAVLRVLMAILYTTQGARNVPIDDFKAHLTSIITTIKKNPGIISLSFYLSISLSI